MARVILFDLNETLLDLSALDPVFQQVFGDARVRRTWFGQVVELFLTVTVIDDYRSFDQLTAAALEMVADQQHVALSEDDRTEVREAMGRLPAYPDVRLGLERLKEAGFRLATLSNSTEPAAAALVEQAGLGRFFERVLSVDAVRRYKPAREAYEYAADQLHVAITDLRLVAAHSWDVAGALKAGCSAAFVARPGKSLNPRAARPDVIGADLLEVADRIVDHDA
jgi:2-haloacid dehalogenase